MVRLPAVVLMIVLLVLVNLASAQLLGPASSTRLALTALASSEEAPVKIDIQDKPLADALAILSKASGYLFLPDSEIRDKTVSLSDEDKPFALLLRLAYAAGAYPIPAVFLCAADEVPTREPKFNLPDSKVTVQVNDTETAVALELVALASKITLRATDKVLKERPQISLDFQDVPLELALSSLATLLECKSAKGLLLIKTEPDALFEQWMNLSPEEQERTLLELTRQAQEMNLSPEEVDEQINKGLNRLWAMPADERQRVIGDVARYIERAGGQIGRFTPEGRQQLTQAWQPFIQRGVGRFLGLPAHRQAELAPIIQALQKLPLQ